MPKRHDSKLSAKHEQFCLEYAIDHNGTKAYVRAGFSSTGAAQSASKLLTLPKIKARIAELDAKTAENCGLSAERVLQGLKNLAFFDPRQFYNEDGTLKSVPEMSQEAAFALCGIEVEKPYDHFAKGQAKDKGTLTKVKFADRGINLERLGRHFKLFTDKVEVAAGDELIARLQAGRKRAQG